jgi:hypothetical protein
MARDRCWFDVICGRRTSKRLLSLRDQAYNVQQDTCPLEISANWRLLK